MDSINLSTIVFNETNIPLLTNTNDILLLNDYCNIFSNDIYNILLLTIIFYLCLELIYFINMLIIKNDTIKKFYSIIQKIFYSILVVPFIYTLGYMMSDRGHFNASNITIIKYIIQTIVLFSIVYILWINRKRIKDIIEKGKEKGL